MIRKSKKNEGKPDFEEMWSEVNEDIQEKDAEDEVIKRTSERAGALTGLQILGRVQLFNWNLPSVSINAPR